RGRHGAQARGRVRRHAPSVHAAGGIGKLSGKFGEPLADRGMDLLGLLGAGDLARADGPNGLVGDHAEAGTLRELVADGIELTEDDLEGSVGLALLQGLADAGDGAEACRDGGAHLVSNEVVRFREVLATLAVADDDPARP